MSTVQTRRSISVKGTTYNRLILHCTGTGQTMSGFVEQLILNALGPDPDPQLPTKPQIETEPPLGDLGEQSLVPSETQIVPSEPQPKALKAKPKKSSEKSQKLDSLKQKGHSGANDPENPDPFEGYVPPTLLL